MGEIHIEDGKLSLFDKRHGKWLDFYNNFSTAECSICGNCFEITIDGEISRVLFEGFKQAYKFCPNCGAKMQQKGRLSMNERIKLIFRKHFDQLKECAEHTDTQNRVLICAGRNHGFVCRYLRHIL